MADDKICFNGEEVERLYIIARNLGSLNAAIQAVRDIGQDDTVIKEQKEVGDVTRVLVRWQMAFYEEWSKLTDGNT